MSARHLHSPRHFYIDSKRQTTYLIRVSFSFRFSRGKNSIHTAVHLPVRCIQCVGNSLQTKLAEWVENEENWEIIINALSNKFEDFGSNFVDFLNGNAGVYVTYVDMKEIIRFCSKTYCTIRLEGEPIVWNNSDLLDFYLTKRLTLYLLL